MATLQQWENSRTARQRPRAPWPRERDHGRLFCRAEKRVPHGLVYVISRLPATRRRIGLRLAEQSRHACARCSRPLRLCPPPGPPSQRDDTVAARRPCCDRGLHRPVHRVAVWARRVRAGSALPAPELGAHRPGKSASSSASSPVLRTRTKPKRSIGVYARPVALANAWV